MSAVAKAVKKVAKAVSNVVQSVGNAVEDVGDTIVKEVVKPVVKTVEKTIDAAMEDPIGTAVKIAAISTGNPAIMAAANAAVAVANGADLEDAAIAAGTAYAAGAIGAEVSSGLAPELASAGDLTASQASTVANVLGQTAGAAATGGDPLSALVTGTIGAGAGAVASEIPGFEDLSKPQQAAISRAIALEAQGKDGSQALINAAIGAGVNAAKDSSGEPVIKAEEDNINDFINQLAESQPEDTLTQQVNDILGIDVSEDTTPAVATTDEPINFITENQQVNQPQEQLPDQTTDDFYKSIGIDPATLSDIPAATEDPLAFLNTSGYYNEITGEFIPDEIGGLQAPLDDTSGTKVLEGGPTTLDPSKVSGTPAPDTSLGDMVTKFLNQTITNKPALAGLAGLGVASALGSSGSSGVSGTSPDQADAGFNPYAEQFVNWNAMPASLDDQGISYGLAQLNPEFSVNAAQGGVMSLAQGGVANYPAAKVDGNEFVLAAQRYGIPDDIGTLNKIVSLVNQGMSPDGAAQRVAKSMKSIGMAQGGTSSLGGYAAGGNPRLLRGPGDGMSDNIPATISNKQPARLADGEFVVPADVVSHLGNGSTEAGANVLYQMMERVRKARTGNSKQGKQINPNKFIPRKGK